MSLIPTYAQLAKQRYPKAYRASPPLAIAQFLSDRARAGIGALKLQKYYPRGHQVFNNKIYHKVAGDRVSYRRTIDVPMREAYPDTDWSCPASIVDGPDAQLTVQIIQIPARKVTKGLDVNIHDFETQAGRYAIAKALHQLRKATR